MKIAMIGTRGVPARYGGFETCVEEVGWRLVERGHEVTVYCRTHNATEKAPLASYRGMKLVHLPSVRKRSLETLSHTALSAMHVVRKGTEAAIVFNSANAPLLPLLRMRGIPVATHVDGLEWQRAKWSGAGKAYYRQAEGVAVRLSDMLIADAQGIADYYLAEFNAPTTQIAYGAPIIEDATCARLEELGLTRNAYHLVVARFEPENHVDIIVDGYVRSQAKKPLVVVGSAPYSDEYTARIRRLSDGRVRLLGGLWDQDLLDQLYAGAYTYWHGHSVGGTNPSLLRAIGAAAATQAFDVGFNREVLQGSGLYFRTAEDVKDLCENVEADPESVATRAKQAQQRARDYDWDDVARRYEKIAFKLAARQYPAKRPSGRRTPAPVAGATHARAAHVHTPR